MCMRERGRERAYPVSFNPFGTCSATITIIIEHNSPLLLIPSGKMDANKRRFPRCSKLSAVATTGSLGVSGQVC